MLFLLDLTQGGILVSWTWLVFDSTFVLTPVLPFNLVFTPWLQWCSWLCHDILNERCFIKLIIVQWMVLRRLWRCLSTSHDLSHPLVAHANTLIRRLQQARHHGHLITALRLHNLCRIDRSRRCQLKTWHPCWSWPVGHRSTALPFGCDRGLAETELVPHLMYTCLVLHARLRYWGAET